MKYARDVMTPKPLCLKEDNTIDEAIEVMLRNSYRGIPVVDENGASKGFVTESSLLKALGVQNAKPEMNLLKHHADTFQPAIVVTVDTKVSDFLNEVITKGNIRVLVKTDVSERVIGIISPRDILKLFSGKLLETLAEEKQRKLDLENLANKRSKSFFDKIDPKNLYHDVFYRHPESQVLFSSRGDMLGMNQAFNLNFGFQEGDLKELKLEHLFEQESYLALLSEMGKGKSESHRSGIVLSILKNAKNLIPVVGTLYTYKDGVDYYHLLSVKIKED